LDAFSQLQGGMQRSFSLFQPEVPVRTTNNESMYLIIRLKRKAPAFAYITMRANSPHTNDFSLEIHHHAFKLSGVS
jgi:hypothetical protein